MFNRRSFLANGVIAAALIAAPRIAFAKAPGDKRFVFIIQRGAADGLHTVAPVGDPGLRFARASLVDDMGPAIKLDSMFALHPVMTNSATLYKGGEALFAHALATANRDRSHFDAQNILETGGTRAYQEHSGWMNRMLGLLPGTRAMAVAQAVPMALRGDRPVASYAPTRLPGASADLMMRVAALYEGDAQLHPLWEQATQTQALVDDLAAGGGKGGQAAGELAARLLAPADGARVMMIETGGWDTHSAQKARLNGQLAGLDKLIGAMKTGLGAEWSNTVVLVATEFGRTVAVNGTGGTDHGTASAALLFGGGVRGGRVIADWPGLRQSDLRDGRDLKPTLALESFVAGAVAGQFALDPAVVVTTLYPRVSGVASVSALLRG
jgi:uncharacterized protein (DUF1501 family)